MRDLHIETLLVPFSRGLVDNPASDTDILCYGISTPVPLEGRLVFVQGFRSFFLKLEKAGCKVLPDHPDASFDMALIRLGRHRGQNEHWLAQAADRIRPGGLVIAAGARTDGAASFRKRLLADMDGEMHHVAANHGVVFWFKASAATNFGAKIKSSAQPLVEGRFFTAPGMFSHQHVDPGSRLLVESLPAELGPKIADFGAGWGYLSVQALEKCRSIVELHLFEADFASLEAARKNLQSSVDVRFHWIDLTNEPVKEKFDSILMNPPFHLTRAAEPDIGRSMIAKSAEALGRGGRLFMVANRNLPYENELDRSFSSYRKIAESGAYKVIEAVR